MFLSRVKSGIAVLIMALSLAGCGGGGGGGGSTGLSSSASSTMATTSDATVTSVGAPAPNGSPSPSPNGSPTTGPVTSATPTPTPVASPSPVASPQASPAPSPQASPSPSPQASPSPSPSPAPPTLDVQLRTAMASAGVTPLNKVASPTAARFALGQALFFDKVISGAKKTSCAACHDPNTALSDGTSLGIGLQGSLPRRTPHLFTRNSSDWRTAFWDSRVSVDNGGVLHTPVDSQVPPGLENATAAQTLFPMQAHDEMRGEPGELDVNGQPNELGNLAPDDFSGAWAGIMNRLMGIPQYVQMFQDAYPGVAPGNFTIAHAANAIASYEASALDFTNTPFDRYLAGDDGAMTAQQKRGALLFYGRARCYECHSGSLLTDQRAHNIAIPQMGPGRPTTNPLDFGFGETTGLTSDRFLFRTPPLRNLAFSPTLMHDGTYTILRDAIGHHLNARNAIATYDPAQQNIAPNAASQLRNDPSTMQAVLATLDPIMDAMPTLASSEMDDLVEFVLNGLRDPAAADTRFLTPASVPSGLTLTN